MQLDNLDIEIIKRALENPGTHQRRGSTSCPAKG